MIEVASKIKNCLVSLCDLYCELPEVIEKEHDALRVSDFETIKLVTIRKNEIGDAIEIQFNIMASYTEKVSLKHASLTHADLQVSKATGMHAIVSRLQDIQGTSQPGNLAHDVLSHVIVGLKDAIDTFEHKMLVIQPLVEMNRKVVGTMLTSYRESYRFWQELSEESVSSYSKDGVQKSQGRLSGFAVKA